MGSVLEQAIEEDFGLVNPSNRFTKSQAHSSLVLDRDKDKFFWNSKGISGGVIDYLTLVRGMSYADAKRMADDSKNKCLFSSEISTVEKVYPDLVNIFHERGRDCRDYWYNIRGYTDETIDRFKLGYSGEWYTIPIFVDGQFKNFQLRKHPKQMSEWYRHSGILPFNFSALLYTDWVVLTEGPVDAIMLTQNKIPAVSKTSGAQAWVNLWNSKFLKLKKFFIVYDNDPAGEIAARKLGELFGYKAKIFTFTGFDKGYDSTDFFKSGGSREEFLHLLDTNSKYYYEV